MRFGFCGPTYQSQSPNVDAERCVNLYPEAVESASARSKMVLYSTPGSRIFANLGATSILGIFACQPAGSITDRVFAIVQSGPNQSLIELFQDGTQSNRGNILTPTTPHVTFAQNGKQLAVCSGGQVWVMDLTTNALSLPAAAPTNVALIDYSDGFLVALLQNSNKFQISGLLDFTSWPGLSVAQVSEFPDNVVSLVVNQRGLFFFGRKATVPYYDAGFLNVPFTPVDGVFIEGGAASVLGRAKLDNSIFWWDASERGQGIARRAQGYIPQRISTHSVEHLVGQYPTISDAISWAEEYEGHSFFVTYFPSGTSPDGVKLAGATWVYDVSTGLWHERAFLNQKAGHYEAHHAQNHAYAWGKHLVGDWSSGNIYEMSLPVPTVEGWDFVTDAGNPIRRLRRAPHITYEREYVFHHSLEIILETGISPQPPLTGPSDAPQNYFLPDAKGGVWALTSDDKGILHIATAPAGVVADTLVLTDASTQTSYLLSVGLDASGQFDGTLAQPTVFDPQAMTSLPIATTSFLDAQIFIVKGQAQTSNPIPHAREPQLLLRWSDDGAHTWSQERRLNCGQAGEYRRRARATRLGRSRLRTYEVSATDPIPWRLVDADLEATPGFQPAQRTIKQFQENA